MSHYSRPYNFNAGPATLPEEVLLQAREEMLDWQETGMSVMEMSHRSKEFLRIAKQAEQDLRSLMGIPETHHVLFLSGGATSQFAMVPLNLLAAGQTADYINTGVWSKKALQEAQKFGQVNVAATLSTQTPYVIPPTNTWRLTPNAAYVHYADNETISGVEFSLPPTLANGAPLVSDMSSSILSRHVDVSRFGLIYAGAQKNLGIAGLTIVIVHRDLIKPLPNHVPTMFSYEQHISNESMLNTPPTYPWYLTSLMLQWLKRQGGIETFAIRNARKASKLYELIDQSYGFYRNSVHESCRSRMNVTFNLTSPELEKQFGNEALAAGLLGLEGHRSLGGFRASIYNAMPEIGVDALLNFMSDFAKKHQ